jgi:hypothetical protein
MDGALDVEYQGSLFRVPRDFLTSILPPIDDSCQGCKYMNMKIPLNGNLVRHPDDLCSFPSQAGFIMDNGYWPVCKIQDGILVEAIEEGRLDEYRAKPG